MTDAACRMCRGRCLPHPALDAPMATLAPGKGQMPAKRPRLSVPAGLLLVLRHNHAVRICGITHLPPKPYRQVKRNPRRKKPTTRRMPMMPSDVHDCPLVSRPGNESMGGPVSPATRVVPTLAKRFACLTWENNTCTYANAPLEFTGPELGCTHPYGCLPSLLGLFDKFWSMKLQRRIVRETNRYASKVP
jgi:hypothetical protein